MPKKGLIFVLILGITGGTVFGQAKKMQISLFGGINPIFEYGSIEDYSLGENDFPVTPSHAPPFFGLAFSYLAAKNVKVELDWRYVFSSKVTLIDPSDEDIVEVDTSKQYFTSLNVLYQFMPNKFRPYFLVGCGMNKFLATAASYISEYGYEIELGVPDKATAFFAQFGGGLDFLVNSSFGVRADVRFVYLFAKPDNIPSLFAGMGAYFLF
ncbi:MAG: hypothetical protein MUP98_02050 [Candidatus Aminicenantes bacterium]|nr:hypothetical protein [Candidatus Aminicenantes bacterium]